VATLSIVVQSGAVLDMKQGWHSAEKVGVARPIRFLSSIFHLLLLFVFRPFLNSCRGSTLFEDGPYKMRGIRLFNLRITGLAETEPYFSPFLSLLTLFVGLILTANVVRN
jgi:hypothetical protein